MLRGIKNVARKPSVSTTTLNQPNRCGEFPSSYTFNGAVC